MKARQQYSILKASTHFGKTVDYSKQSVKDISLIGLSMYAAPFTYNSMANSVIQTNFAIKMAKFFTGTNHVLEPFGNIVNKLAHSLIENPMSWFTGITVGKFSLGKAAEYATTESKDSNLVKALFSPVTNPFYISYHTSIGLYNAAKVFKYSNKSDENYGFDIDINKPFVDLIDSSDKADDSETLKLERLSLQEREDTDDRSSPVLIDILRNKYSVTLGILSDDTSFVSVSMSKDDEVDCIGCNESTFNYIEEI